jgi:hypothetical protein
MAKPWDQNSKDEPEAAAAALEPFETLKNRRSIAVAAPTHIPRSHTTSRNCFSLHPSSPSDTMQCMKLFVAITLLALFVTGCTTRQFTFRAVDAQTAQPLKGIYVYQRNVHTQTPTDRDHVLWAFDTLNPIPTDSNGIFHCYLDDAHWHVLLFQDRKPWNDASKNDHVEQYVTIPPNQTTLQIGNWPKEGPTSPATGTITIKLQTYSDYWAKLKSPATQPTTSPNP